MWTARFAKAHGVTVPLHAAEHFYVVTEPIPNLPASLPALVLFEERSYWKEDAGKLLIGGFEARAKPWGAAGIPDGFEFDELPFDMEQTEPVLEKVFARMPSLESVGIRTFFTGPESFTPDGRPYIGPAPELPGLFVAAGMNSHGIMNSGGVGLTLAAWILEGQPHRSVGSMLASRAMPFQCNAAYNEERVTESLGMHWGLHWPGRQTETARQIRRVPLHASLAAAGAKFAERVGWEVPMYFDADAEGWPNRPSMGYQDWSPRVAAEVEAVEHATGLLDQSMYAKILVQGPDAVHALNRVSAAQMDVPIGTSVYAQFLNERGGIEADITATRLSADRFLVLAGHPSQIRDAHWIRAHADRDWRFEVVDMTSALQPAVASRAAVPHHPRPAFRRRSVECIPALWWGARVRPRPCTGLGDPALLSRRARLRIADPRRVHRACLRKHPRGRHVSRIEACRHVRHERLPAGEGVSPFRP